MKFYQVVSLSLIGACCGFVVGCQGDDPADEAAVDVTQAGPHRVGTQELSLTYRPEGFDADRTLRLVLWYPTEETDGLQPLFGNGTIDAAPMATGDFPVLIYSHGRSSFAECAYSLTEHFASHGFVVASADHSGDTTSERDLPRTTEMYLLRPQDVSAVIDAVYGLPESHPLAGRLTDELALVGHSYGGFTAFAAAGAGFSEEKISGCDETSQDSFCSTMTDEFAALFRRGFDDDRIKAVIPMAPGNAGELGPAGVGDIDIPTMLMSATLDGNCPNDTQGDPYWSAITHAHAMRVNYDKGGHHSYIFTCAVTPWVGDENGGGCGDDFTDYEILLDATNIYSLAFVRRHLFGDMSMDAILSGETSTFEDVTLSHR